jgi:N-acetylmuramoyl-L-alanine amidase CwlA
MVILDMLAPSGSRCRSGRKLADFKGVTIHNTGNAAKGADALAHAKYLQGGGANSPASWHYCVDEKTITRSIPETEIAWHAGDGSQGSGNTKTVAIEICMNADGDIRAATDRAAELAAYILRRRGYCAAAKYLFQHHHWTGKNCPQKIREGIPYNWDAFVKKVQLHLEGRDMTVNEAKGIIKARAGLSDETIQYLWSYRWGDELILKLAQAMKGA